jgi:hypothetical protein
MPNVSGPNPGEDPGSPQSSTSPVNGSVIVMSGRMTLAVPVNLACPVTHPNLVNLGSRKLKEPSVGRCPNRASDVSQ